jgi:hypothetical protein
MNWCVKTARPTTKKQGQKERTFSSTSANYMSTLHRCTMANSDTIFRSQFSPYVRSCWIYSEPDCHLWVAISVLKQKLRGFLPQCSYAVQQATLRGGFAWFQIATHRSRDHGDRVFFIFGIFFPTVFLPNTIRKQKRRRGQRFLPSGGRCTGTQKVQRRGQKLRTASKSRLLDRIVSPEGNATFCFRTGNAKRVDQNHEFDAGQRMRGNRQRAVLANVPHSATPKVFHQLTTTRVVVRGVQRPLPTPTADGEDVIQGRHRSANARSGGTDFAGTKHGTTFPFQKHGTTFKPCQGLNV